MVNSLVKLEKKAEEKEEYIKLLKERLGNQKVPDQQEEEEDEEEEEDGQESMDHENEGTLCIFLQSKTFKNLKKDGTEFNEFKLGRWTDNAGSKLKIYDSKIHVDFS